jgi:hypothetical protein
MLSSPRNVLGAPCLTGVAASLASRSLAADKDDMIPLDKLPPAVLAAAKEESPAAVWKVASKIDSGGEISYEISGVIGSGEGKRLITVEVADDGEVITVSEMIEQAKVPAKVMDAFKKEYSWKKGTYAFEVREDDEVVSYEFVTTRARKTKGKGKGKAKGKAKGKGKEKEETITVIISPDGSTVEVEGEDD